MSLRYDPPQGLCTIHLWFIQEIHLKSAVWLGNRRTQTYWSESTLSS